MWDDPFWLVTWSLTVILCLYKLVEALFVPRRMLEWPFLACIMWIYFYGYMAYKAKLTLSAYLGHGMADIGQLMPLLCLIGLLVGWSCGLRVPVRGKWDKTRYPYLQIALLGIFFVLLGAAGNYSVSHVQNEGQLNYQASSAYWYLLYYVGYPGLSLAVWATLRIKTSSRYVLMVLIVITLVAFMMPQVLNARRGPLFPAILVLLLVPPLTLRQPPSRLVYFGGLLALGVVMLMFVQVRTIIYNGGTWGEALQNLNVESAVVERGDDADDNEYVNNCQLIGTLYENGKYNYGTGHMELLVHWVPRAFWPSKPSLGEGIYSFNQLVADMEQATGVQLLGFGASAAGVADSFLQYGIFCPIFWFAVAFGVAVIYGKVLHTNNPWWMFAYVGLCCATHWLISQSFTAASVPGMYFQAVPLAVMLVLRYYRSSAGSNRRVGQRPRPQPLPQPISPA